MHEERREVKGFGWGFGGRGRGGGGWKWKGSWRWLGGRDAMITSE